MADKAVFETVDVPLSQNAVICESNLRHQCQLNCACHHYPLPYHWQICCGQPTWHSFPAQQNMEVECAFCQPHINLFSFQMLIEGGLVAVSISFDPWEAKCLVNNCLYAADVRRLSTISYYSDKDIVIKGGLKTDHFVTQWRWYYNGDGLWQLFGRSGLMPKQCVLEAKYLHGQPVYRFETMNESEYAISLQPGKFEMVSLKHGSHWQIRRRPLYLSQLATGPLESPPISANPFTTSLPSSWFPVDADSDYELVPLDPSGMEYHLVASAFHESVSNKSRQITDIFRIQNPFLWHKYYSKRRKMELNGARHSRTTEPLERQLFHGTRDEQAVKAIFKQNFDWRLSGSANDVQYGRGAYFAQNANFSDRYAKSASKSRLSWMFLARVLTGRMTVGKRDYVRPPPVEPRLPHGELYDSCVNDINRPLIFVIFDTDQYYPEYVISYAVV